MKRTKARQVQIRRGTADEHNEFVGAVGEITMDTTNKTIRVHDGQTVGGTELARKDMENIEVGTVPGARIWISEEFTPSAATRTIAQHNLNINPLYARGEILLKCAIAEAGYTPGEYCSNWTPSGVNSNLAFPICRGVTLTENTIETTTGADTIAALAKSGSNQYVFLRISNWRYVFRVFY